MMNHLARRYGAIIALTMPLVLSSAPGKDQNGRSFYEPYEAQELVRDLKHNPWKFFWRE